MNYTLLKYFFILIYFASYSHAYDISKTYPSYRYVLNEFDIDKSYIYNDEFVYFALNNEKNLKRFYKRSLQRGKKLLPMMKGLLMHKGVSDVFIYLSMIESGFSSSAVSPKKAVGLWQFMPSTAKNYHLTVCDTYDERCDTASATLAAVAYLNKLHKQFGKWYLAALAYNCGEGCVERAIQKAGTDELSILTDNTLKYLPEETRTYMKKILLVAMMGENSTLDFATISSKPLKHDVVEVEVKGGTNLKKLAHLLKMKYTVLHRLNPKISDAFVPNTQKTHKITIPIEKIFAFYLRYDLISETRKPESHFISHYVKLGETLQSIAKMYHTQSIDIMVENHLDDIFLSVDQLLVIPVSQKIFEKVSIGTSK
ncbi:MAG TPA: LysM peptidoglycan-binding domain-containing protein [Epsilonproteobacteria bacterium]|nr:LysM peptidoglycan-binding domain-containing protein [Campylobacterota bacterium]